MEILKSYFKVLKRYAGQMIMYVGIFTGIMIAVANSSSQSNEAEKYVSKQAKYAVADYDNSELSKALTDYLGENHILVKEDIKDEAESIQDGLYNRDIHCFVRIPEGFGDGVKNGNKEHSLSVVAIPGTSTSRVFESDIDGYLNKVSIFLDEGYSVKEAVEATKEILNTEVEVSLPEADSTNERTTSYRFFVYLGWIFIVMMIVSISPVLQVYGKKELRDRIECSSYKFVNINKELILGVIITGVAICVAVFALASVILRGETFTYKGLWFALNMLVYMILAGAFAFLVSNLTTNEQIVSMLANIISLGMSFICGIFVPIEYMGEKVIRAAHLLPAYWYNIACIRIDQGVNSNIKEIVSAMGIQLLFAVSIIIIGIVIAKRKRVE